MPDTISPHDIRLGRIKATIWANATDKGTRFNVKFGRLYKDGTEWRTSDSFGREDLLLVAKVADLAHTWIYEQSSAGERQDQREDTEPSDQGVDN